MKVLASSPAAAADIEMIWNYSADNWGPDQADLYIDRIRDVCEAVAAGNRPTRPVAVRAGYEKVSTGSHVVNFRVYENRVEITRIVHAKQDVERHL